MKKSLFIVIMLAHNIFANITGEELKNLKSGFDIVSTMLTRIGEKNPIRSPYKNDTQKIQKIFEQKELTQEDLKAIIDILKVDKYKLQNEENINLEITLQIAPGIKITQPIKYLTDTIFSDYLAQLQNYSLSSTANSGPQVPVSKIDDLRKNFRPIFFMFYDLYKHAYYKNLDRLRTILHQQVITKDNLQEMLSILKWKKLRLQDEDQNQQIYVEINQRERVTQPLKYIIRTYLEPYIQKIEGLIQQL